MSVIDGKRLLLLSLRCALTEEAPPKELSALSEEDFAGLFALAKHFDVAPMVAYALKRAGDFPQGETAERLRRAQTAAVFRTERQLYEKERIGAALERAGIEHIFLKGTAVRPLYREPWLRTGADIDILVRKADHERACRLLRETLSCTRAKETAHDSALRFPDGTVAELHFSLTEQHPAWENALRELWETVLPAEGRTYEKRLSPEYLYVYFFIHTAKHFERGGIGLRPMTDLYLMRRHWADDREQEGRMLAAAGLEKFAAALEKLTEHWFASGEADELTRRTERYVFEGGIYGGMQNRVKVGQTVRGGKWRYALYRAFMPYEELIALYPSLRGRKGLLPLYWVRRWGYHLFGGTLSGVRREWRQSRTVPQEEAEQTKNYLKELGLL